MPCYNMFYCHQIIRLQTNIFIFSLFRSRVQNLFHSVQLNVNNPHFLIMQGRITKVLNMKPPEILGLLEEAAGTKMYESKKQAALRTLEKKQVKVDEINKVLHEDIMPALEKLRKEKVQYMEWQNASANLEKLERFCVAYKYVEALSLREDGETEIAEAEKEIVMLNQNIDQTTTEINNYETGIDRLKKEKESQSSGEMKAILQKVDDLSKQLVKETSQWNNLKDAAKTEEVTFNQLKANLEELSEESLNKILASANAKKDLAIKDLDNANEYLKGAQSELAGIEAGDGRDASNRSMQERIEIAQNSKVKVDADIKTASNRIKHLEKQLQTKEKALASKKKEGSEMEKKLSKQATLVEKLREKLESLKFDSIAASSLQNKIDEGYKCIQKLQDRIDELSSQLSGIDFQYQAPEKGFDHSRVKGVVAKLVHIKDPQTTTALEVTAAGKLYQVVVDNEATAKSLLANGRLRSRVTIIPLDRVAYRSCSREVKEAATRLSGGKALPAIELVGYDCELDAAMKYVFGTSFVCKDDETAKKLAFTKEVGTRSVTLDGDDFNPGGTLTGGSRANKSSVLKKLHALKSTEAEMEKLKAEIKQNEKEMKAISSTMKEHEKLSKQLDLESHSLELLKQRFEGSDLHRAIEQVNECKNELEIVKKELGKSTNRMDELEAEIERLQKEIKNFDQDKGKLIAAAKGKITDAKSRIEACKKELKIAEKEVQIAVTEGEVAGKERESIRAQLQSSQESFEKLLAEAEDMAKLVSHTKQAYDEAAVQLENQQKRLKECDAEISTAIKACSILEAKKTDLIVQQKKANNRLEALHRSAADATDRCLALERDYPWIDSERKHFGKPNSDYDWTANDPTEVFKKWEEARVTIDALSTKVNKKVMQMFEKAEQEYNELKRKKDVVETDKLKIRDVMEDLDEKKREALMTTWKKVNVDLGSIFSTLLPGATAKLEPEEGTTFLDGLEVKVAFGGVWKDSLGELSGGQKSLLALSLILAMLLFKPAPIYILDEVDAALDLSHTQNIGRMIKTHFPQSQFIVVSLKEGMFNNANVIFRTKFIDGVSTVTRTIREQKDQRISKHGERRERSVLKDANI